MERCFEALKHEPHLYRYNALEVTIGGNGNEGRMGSGHYL